jgi:Heterokaryon incompatibility protein (HET)
LFAEDSSSSESLKQAVDWLRDCLENHAQCQWSRESETELPTRILDVGSLEEEDPQVKLYETKAETGLYVALSHCWGESQMIKTEHSSFNARKNGIPWDRLPKSFQDAITFVRNLGIRYLWIDALCIIQDDKGDWERESAKMATIYASSILTIAATKSADSSGGCFSTVPNRWRTYKISGFDKYGSEFKIYARPEVSNWEKSPLPLYSRAWCFQERILSPRILHFEYNELKWECNTIITRESTLTTTSGHNEKALRLSQESDPHSMNDKWRKLVHEYVELDLTYESDRLPALSGLAKHIKKTYGRGRYLAGLWEDSLFEDLMWWIREEDVHATRRSKEWRAPSWSWASVEGRIMHRIFPINSKHCTVIDVQVTAAGNDPTGTVASGNLVLSGTLLPATLRTIRPKSVVGEDELDHKNFGIEIKGTVGVKSHKIYVDYELDKGGNGHVPDGQEVFCFCIATDQWHKCWLILRKVQSNPDDVHERIGMAWQSHAQIKDGQDWAILVSETTIVTIV